MLQVHGGVLALTTKLDRPTDGELRGSPHAHGFTISSMELCHDKGEERRILRYELRWRSREPDPKRVPIQDWADMPGVVKMTWTPSRIA